MINETYDFLCEFLLKNPKSGTSQIIKVRAIVIGSMNLCEREKYIHITTDALGNYNLSIFRWPKNVVDTFKTVR